ncbi:MAG: ArnT family glycosyltransferase [Candidatus Kapaibacterium sp.]
MNPNNKWTQYLLVALIGAIFFLPYLGAVHLFDWDEINFAEAAREMIVTGDYLTVRINYEPFHEKPPLFIWMQAASMHAFGINEFAARLPNAIIGIMSLLAVFTIGRRLFDYKFGFLWVLAWLGSFLPHFYFKSGIIDPTFNLFIFGGIYYLYKYYDARLNHPAADKRIYRSLIWGGVMCSLAILTKGPVGYLLTFIAWMIFWFMNRKRVKFPFMELAIFTAIAVLLPLVWYGVNMARLGSDLVTLFIDYHMRLLTTGDAGHSGPIYYHFVVLLFGCFPASVIALRGFRLQPEDIYSQRDFKRWMVILLSVVLIIFSVVETKIVHYSSLAYFPITFLAAYAMYGLAFRSVRWKASTAWLLGIIGFLMGAALALLPLVLMNVEMILPKVTDKFTNALLRTDAGWLGFEYMIGIVYIIALAIALLLFYKRMPLRGFFVMFGASAIVLFTFLPLIAPRIEAYTQRANIEFYRNLQGCDCYVMALDHKSYAQYFYTRRPPELSENNLPIPKDEFKDWLLEGDIDRPAYFIVRNKGYEKYLEFPGVEEMYSKNGFVFLMRPAVENNPAE